MTQQEYKERSKTAEGRKQLHGVLIEEAAKRLRGLVDVAPEQAKTKLSGMMEQIICKLPEYGNSNLFNFCDDRMTTKQLVDVADTARKYFGLKF